ncbi:MAG: FecR family protein [Candidatus Cryptobacteroides sp.]
MDDSLIYRFFAGETTENENDALQRWIESSPSNMEKFNRAHEMWLLGIFSSDVLNGRGETEGKKPKTGRMLLYGLSCAAALLVGCFATWMFFVRTANELIDNAVLVSQSLPDQRSHVVLPDGTSVELNVGSRIEYPAIFNKRERRVKVEGEAILDVAQNDRQPFVVETFAYDVRVVGTKFDILADKAANEFSTALFEGKVELLNKKNEVCATLLPDQLAYMLDGKLKLRKMNEVEDDYGWSDGIVTLSSLPFDAVVRKLERCYGVRIVLDCETLPVIEYNYLKIRISNGIEYALKVLGEGSDFEWRYDDTEQVYHIY